MAIVQTQQKPVAILLPRYVYQDQSYVVFPQHISKLSPVNLPGSPYGCRTRVYTGGTYSETCASIEEILALIDAAYPEG